MARVEISFPEVWNFSMEISVRIDDINFGGHLAHDSILTLMHEARARFFRSLGYGELDIEGRGIIMADAAIVYKSEAFFGDILRFDLAAVEIGRRGFEIVYRIMEKKSGREIALGKTGLVMFNYELREPCEIPETFKAALSSKSIGRDQTS